MPNSAPAYTIGGLTRPALNFDAGGHILLEGPVAEFAAQYGLQALYLQARRFGNFSVIERAGQEWNQAAGETRRCRSCHSSSRGGARQLSASLYEAE